MSAILILHVTGVAESEHPLRTAGTMIRARQGVPLRYSPPNLISKSLTTRFTPGMRLLRRIAFRKSQSSKTIPCNVAMPFETVTNT